MNNVLHSDDATGNENHFCDCNYAPSMLAIFASIISRYLSDASYTYSSTTIGAIYTVPSPLWHRIYSFPLNSVAYRFSESCSLS
jgi:hypothetical protein